MEELTLYRGALDLLSGENAHTTTCMARDANGWHVGVCDHRATCWCLVGALERVHLNHAKQKVLPAMDCPVLLDLVRKALVKAGNKDVAESSSFRALTYFNDNYPHDVLDLLETACVRIRSQATGPA